MGLDKEQEKEQQENTNQQGIDQEQSERDRKQKLTIIIAIVLGVALVIFIGYRMIYQYKLEQAELINEELRKTAIVEVVPEIEIETETETEEIEEFDTEVDVNMKHDVLPEAMNITLLQRVNPDIYAWIIVPGTDVDYPILQSETDDYYLNHTVDNVSGLPGAVYTNTNNTTDFSDNNTIVYGHNMKNGTMFSSLHNFESESFFNENQYAYIYTTEGRLKYQIIAATPFTNDYLPDTYKFTFSQEVERFIKDISSYKNSQKRIREGVVVRTDDKLLTLSTCVTGENEKRYLVLAVKIEDE